MPPGDSSAGRRASDSALGAALLLGPLALALLGLFGWLMLLAVATVALTIFASARRADRLPRRHSGKGGRWAVPRP